MDAPDMDLTEGVGESSSPPPSFALSSGGGCSELADEVYIRLLESGHPEAVGNPDLRDILESHFARLPPSYALDVNMEKAEDVLLHHRLLDQATVPDKQPAFHVRFLEHISVKADGVEEDTVSTSTDPNERQFHNDNDETPPTPGKRSRVSATEFEACSKLEDLNLDVRKNIEDAIKFSKRQELTVPIHEVIFSTVDKPKLLSQLSSLLSEIGLNIREAHVFSTTDGYSLDVFVVDGWQDEDTDGLNEAMVKAIDGCEGTWSGSTHSQSAIERALAARASGDLEIDRRLLKMGEKITSGSFGDLFRGTYLGQDVAIKILRTEHMNEAPAAEFAQEVEILREVQHQNVVSFVGACTKSPPLCIVTEYMPGGSLYDLLHNHHDTLNLSQLVKFALDISKGMEYLHQNNIIHRDLKTANLLMDGENVVKVADFGIARFQSQGGVMTAETGTYRWMAPEVINHQPYNQKADVFSFAIVIWELFTAKVPYSNLTPLQAALGVRQGLRPEVPQNMPPELVKLMQRCWDTDPAKRPSFSELTVELENLLKNVQKTSEASSSGS